MGRFRPWLHCAATVAICAAGCGNPVVSTPPGKRPAPGATRAAGGASATPATRAPAIATRLTGVVIGAATRLISNNGGAFISENGGAFISENGGAFISENGGAVVSNHGGAIIANHGGGIIANNGGGVIANNGAGLTSKVKYGLRQAVDVLEVVPGAEVQLVDAAGKPLGPAVKTDAKGAYALDRFAGASPVAFVSVRYEVGGLPVRLVAAADLAAADPRQDVTPATTLVTKKVQALVGKGLVDGASFSIQGVRDATDAVARYMSGQAAVGASVVDAGRGEQVFDVMMASAAPLREQIAAISVRSKIPFVLGQSNLGDGGAATATALGTPVAVAFDPREPGAFVIVDRVGSRIRRVDAQGRIATIAGTGTIGYAGDGGPATAAALQLPEDAIYAKNGDLYVADAGNGRIRRIRTDGVIETVAGSGEATLDQPLALAWDRDEQGLFFADYRTGLVWRLDLATGALKREAGDGRELGEPLGLAADLSTSPATLYVAGASGALQRIGPDRVVSTLALGGGEAALKVPRRLAFGPDGRLYFADRDQHRVGAVDLKDPALAARTAMGRSGTPGTGSEVGDALAVRLSRPEYVTFDLEGRMVVCDTLHGLVRRVGADGLVTTIAGQLAVPKVAEAGRAVSLNRPLVGVVDARGDLYVCDGLGAKVYKVAKDGTIGVYAGTGEATTAGDGGPATQASFTMAAGLAFDREGRLLVSDWGGGGSVRRIAADGTIATIATGLAQPAGLAVDSQGTIYVAESDNNHHRVMAVKPGGEPTVLIGKTGAEGRASGGDGGPAAEGTVFGPISLQIDAQDRLYVCELKAGKVRRIALREPGRPVSTFLAGLLAGGTLPFTAPTWLAFDPTGRAVVSDLFANRVVRVEADGAATVLAGEEGRAFANPASVDEGLKQPSCVAFEPDGGMWIVDSGNNQLKYVPAASLE